MKQYKWLIEFHKGSMVVIANCIDSAVLEAKRKRLQQGLNSIVLSCRRLEQ